MKKWFLLFIIHMGVVQLIFSQATNDAGLWATVNVEKKLTKRWELFLSQEYRLKENFTQTNLFYTDLGASFKPYGFMKVSLSYRWVQKQMPDETYSFRHRITMDVLLKKKFGKIVTSFRQRVQSQVRNVYTSEKGRLPEWYAREKLEIKYDLDKPIQPFISGELRYQWNNPRDMATNGSWDRIRYTLGLDYKLNQRHSLSLYYMIQREFNVIAPQNLYIIGVAYTLSL